MLQYAPSTQATFWCPALLGLRSTIPVCEAWGYEYCSGSVTKNLTGWRKCPLLCVLGLLFVIKNQNNLYETMKWWVQVPAKGMNKEPILWLFLFIEVCLHLHHPVCLFFLVLGSKHKWNYLRLFCFQDFIVKIMKHTFYSSYLTVSLSWIWEKKCLNGMLHSWNCHMKWTLKICSIPLRHFFLKSSLGTPNLQNQSFVFYKDTCHLSWSKNESFSPPWFLCPY